MPTAGLGCWAGGRERLNGRSIESLRASRFELHAHAQSERPEETVLSKTSHRVEFNSVRGRRFYLKKAILHHHVQLCAVTLP